ncbi:hypothetical protein UlMin_039646 [Ulmus minor]
MAMSRGGNKALFNSLRPLLFKQQKLFNTLAEGGLQSQVYPEIGSDFMAGNEGGHMDMSKWKKVDSKKFGINRSMIPSSSWTVLKILRNHGFDAYLVGGCVRDLILNRTPKDFDVITTASLKQIRNQFHRALIVGQRFPICIVRVQGSAIEVSSFETVAKEAGGKELDFSQVPCGCGKKDFTLWRNSFKRDFTINSLFYDPFLNKIYDYANGIADLKSLKLRTLIPAEVSFEEDCARILRGLRIAARLGLSFAEETETAIHNLSSSVMKLAKARIMMEMNYMLSYGAAEPSLHLLQQFNLLKLLLPFHAAYLEQHSRMRPGQSSMLMKLFLNMDKVVSCDCPSDCRLWVGLLAFHLALVNIPQDPLVVVAFASILYHGDWKEGLRFARENAQVQDNFLPELSRPFESKSDEELAEELSQLATLVQDSIDVLTETESLIESMSRYPVYPCSGLVFVSKKIGRDIAEIFQVLVEDVESHEEKRESYEIDYRLLGKGYLCETRFVLGKVILETMGCSIPREEEAEMENKDIHFEIIDEKSDLKLSDLVKEVEVKEDIKVAKKRKLLENNCNLSKPDITLEKQGLHLKVNETDEFPLEGLLSALANTSEERGQLPDEKLIKKKKKDNGSKKRQNKDQTPPLALEKRYHVPPETVDEQLQEAGEEKIKEREKKAHKRHRVLPDTVDKQQEVVKEKIKEHKRQVDKRHHVLPETLVKQQDAVMEKIKEHKKQVARNTKGNRPSLSNLFR